MELARRNIFATGWLIKTRWTWPFIRKERDGVAKACSRLECVETHQYSLSAQALIFLVTFSWSRVVDERLFSGDAIWYFQMLKDGSWPLSYPFEQTMFRVLSLLKPETFGAYVFISGAIPLTILLYAFYKLNYSRLDQFLLTAFFSCSFYGIHFLLDFQRQFYAIVFFMLAVSLKRGSIVACIASLFSHLFAFLLPIFWIARKLTAKKALFLSVVFIPAFFMLAQAFLDTKVVGYYTGLGEGENNIVLKQSLNIGYALIVFLTVKEGENPVRTLSLLYIAMSVPTLFWKAYGGVFARLDYYFFPIMIATWPMCVAEKKRRAFVFVILFSTIVGFFLWNKMNFAWIIQGVQ